MQSSFKVIQNSTSLMQFEYIRESQNYWLLNEWNIICFKVILYVEESLVIIKM